MLYKQIGELQKLIRIGPQANQIRLEHLFERNGSQTSCTGGRADPNVFQPGSCQVAWGNESEHCLILHFLTFVGICFCWRINGIVWLLILFFD